MANITVDLDQYELETAVKEYIGKQGYSMNNKFKIESVIIDNNGNTPSAKVSLSPFHPLHITTDEHLLQS